MKKAYPFIIVLSLIFFLIVEPILTVKAYYHALGDLDNCAATNQRDILFAGAIVSLAGIIFSLLMSVKLHLKNLKTTAIILLPVDLIVGCIVIMTAACFF